MDAALIRQLIQQRLWDRRLPHELTIRIDVEDWGGLRFHMACFAIWDDERLKRTARTARNQSIPFHDSPPRT
jgi:hypothetical protein